MTTAPSAPEDLGKTASGMQPNFAALLSYALWIITGLAVFLTEKENKFVRFHAMQAICLSLAAAGLNVALWMIPFVGWMLLPVLQLGLFIVWVVCMVQAYRGRWFRLPVIGDVSAKQAGLSS